MFTQRGNASLTEITSSSLCEVHKINYEEWREFSVPLDLIAIFSTSPEEFSRHFSLHPRKDMLEDIAELIKNINDGFKLDLAVKLKRRIEGEAVEFCREEKEELGNVNSPFGYLIDQYRKKGILVDKLFDLPQQELEQQSTLGITPVTSTSLLNSTNSSLEESRHIVQEQGNMEPQQISSQIQETNVNIQPDVSLEDYQKNIASNNSSNQQSNSVKPKVESSSSLNEHRLFNRKETTDSNFQRKEIKKTNNL